MFSQLWPGSRTRECGIRREQRRRKWARRPGMESLDARCLLSGDVVIQWNQAVIAAIEADKLSIGPESRDLAIVQTPIYDAVDAIDHNVSGLDRRATGSGPGQPRDRGVS